MHEFNTNYPVVVYREDRGASRLMLDLAVRLLTTNPFRRGAPFLLPIATPPEFGRSLRVFIHSLLIFGQHLSYRMDGDRFLATLCKYSTNVVISQ